MEDPDEVRIERDYFRLQTKRLTEQCGLLEKNLEQANSKIWRLKAELNGKEGV